jgi:hypothetical protein
MLTHEKTLAGEKLQSVASMALSGVLFAVRLKKIFFIFSWTAPLLNMFGRWFYLAYFP